MKSTNSILLLAFYYCVRYLTRRNTIVFLIVPETIFLKDAFWSISFVLGEIYFFHC